MDWGAAKKLDCIVRIYVTWNNNSKIISLVTAAVYSVIYPELCSKKDPFLMYGLTSAFLIWIAANHHATMHLLCGCATGDRRGVHIPPIPRACASAPSISLWNFITGDIYWQTRSVETLIYSVNCLVAAVIIVVPGRTARMLATLHMNMLALKQIFVRYVSHEIRSPLNIVYAGLDIIRHELELKDGSPVIQNSTDTAKMIEDIFSASESAIANVNELHYEHLDSLITQRQPWLGFSLEDSIFQCAQLRTVDSVMNRKLISKIISGEQLGRLSVGEILEIPHAERGDASRSVRRFCVDGLRDGGGEDAAGAPSTMPGQSSGCLATHCQRQDISRFVTHEANEVLIKPLSRVKLLEAIARRR
eukprot:gene29175-38240_t